MKNQKGFTLIELLVVIAIIGVLASVVLASLNTARTKGNDAAVKSNLSGIRAQAELLYDDASPNDYDAVCGVNGVTQDTNVADAIAAAASANGAGTVTCGAPTSGAASAWAIAADLPGGGAFCVDSSGTARTSTTGGSAYTVDLGAGTPALSSANDSSCQ